MPHDFVPLAERIVDALLESDPRLAASAGDHRFDDRLPDLSADGVAADVAMLRDAAGALSQVDPDAARRRRSGSTTRCSLARVERTLFELTEIREHEWNPLVHNPGDAAARADRRGRSRRPSERLESLAGRLAAVPDALATARAMLDDCPRIHLETAAGQFPAPPRWSATSCRVLLRPGARRCGRRWSPSPPPPSAALDEFAGWLRARVDGRRRAATPGWAGGCGRPGSGTRWTPS